MEKKSKLKFVALLAIASAMSILFLVSCTSIHETTSEEKEEQLKDLAAECGFTYAKKHADAAALVATPGTEGYAAALQNENLNCVVDAFENSAKKWTFTAKGVLRIKDNLTVTDLDFYSITASEMSNSSNSTRTTINANSTTSADYSGSYTTTQIEIMKFIPNSQNNQ